MAGGEGGVGWSGISLQRAGQVLDYLDSSVKGAKVPFSAGLAIGDFDTAEDLAETSDNHEAMLANIEAARAYACGTKAEQDRARGVLLRSYYPRELGYGTGNGVGLWGREPFAVVGHDHQHLCGTSFARLAAILSHDAELIELSARLLCTTMSAGRAVSTPDLQRWSCGVRCAGEPLAFVHTAWQRMVAWDDSGTVEFQGKRAAANWRDPMFVSVRCLRYLRQQVLDDLGGAAQAPIAGCKLSREMIVYRGDDAHLAVFPQRETKGKGDTCSWVLCPHEWQKDARPPAGAQAAIDRRTRQSVRFGMDWKTEPPPPPKGSYVVRFGT